MSTVLDLGALGAVLAEWLAIGWLSGVRWPDREGAWVPDWSLRLLVGAVLLGTALMLLALGGLSVTFVPSGLVAAAVLAVVVRTLAGARYLRPQNAPRVSQCRPGGRQIAVERAGWAAFGLLILAAWARSWLVPESGWDAYSHWGLKARAYALAGTIVDTHGAHEYYPPLVVLLEAWLYTHRGTANIDLAKTIWPAIGGAFGVCFGWHLRGVCRDAVWLAPWGALGMLLLTTQLLESFWTGQADLPLTAFLTLGVLALFRYQVQRGQPGEGRDWLAQAALMSAGAALCKFEGAARVAVPVLALALEAALVRREWRRLVLAAVVPALAAGLFYAPWALLRQKLGFEISNEHLSRLRLEAIGGVARALVATLGGVRTGGGIVLATLALVGAATTAARPPIRFLLVTTVGQVAFTLLAFLVTDYSPELQVSLSATRLLMQLLPVALFAALIAWRPPASESAQANGNVPAGLV